MLSPAVIAVQQHSDILLWQQVPTLVRTRLKQAGDVQRALKKILPKLPPAMPGYGYLFWNPEANEVWAVLGDSDDEQKHQKWHNALKAIPGVEKVRTESEFGPHDNPDWIKIKKADSWLDAPYQAAGKLTGGPSPLSNTIVNMLVGGGLGYGAGAIAEDLFPERYVERGKLRKTLGLLGAGAGAVPGLIQTMSNAGLSNRANKPLGAKALITPDSQVPMHPDELNWAKSLDDGTTLQKASAELTRGKSPADSAFLRATLKLVKAAQEYTSGLDGTGGVALQPIAVDAFNQAVWNDVYKGVRSSHNNPLAGWSQYGPIRHTEPPIGAAVVGLVSGLQQSQGAPDIMTPKHFMNGLLAAGTDLAAARVAGGILGTLGGLTPDAQQKLQDMGVWGGMMRGVVQSVFGR